MQWEVVGRTGQWVGQVDFDRPGLSTVGEFDGRIRYGRLLRSGQSPADAVFAEKRRVDALRAEGLAVVRWGWADPTDVTETRSRLLAAFARA